MALRINFPAYGGISEIAEMAATLQTKPLRIISIGLV